jgi:hypothetical protein
MRSTRQDRCLNRRSGKLGRRRGSGLTGRGRGPNQTSVWFPSSLFTGKELGPSTGSWPAARWGSTGSTDLQLWAVAPPRTVPFSDPRHPRSRGDTRQVRKPRAIYENFPRGKAIENTPRGRVPFAPLHDAVRHCGVHCVYTEPREVRRINQPVSAVSSGLASKAQTALGDRESLRIR